MKASRERLRLILLRLFRAVNAPAHQCESPTLPAAPRILLIRPDHLGDLLFATPALRVLRRAFPDAHLACMVGPWGKAVLESNPHLDEIMVCEFPAFSRQPKASLLAPYRMLEKWAAELKPRHFDLAIVLRFDHWWGALLAYLAGIPRRLGYAIAECQPFLTQAVPYCSGQHEVEQNLGLAQQVIRDNGRPLPEASPQLEFTVLASDQDFVTAYLASRRAWSEEGLIGIHPGAGAPVKLWRAEAFAEVADALVESWTSRVVITGGPEEIDLAWSVYAHMRADAIVAAGDTTLGQLAALFQRCRLVIGPDCGPLHLAVAMGTPTIHLYGPVDRGKFGPWGNSKEHLVITSGRDCIPCSRLDYSVDELPSHPCVREIPVAAVLGAANSLLATQRKAA
jgi:lipopolysaccharide heptosyltransferase II